VTVMSAVLAFLIFAEVPRPLQIVGSVIVIVGVVLAGQRKPSVNSSGG
jgi:drug/metabolite transporter (DMT)-like permease